MVGKTFTDMYQDSSLKEKVKTSLIEKVENKTVLCQELSFEGSFDDYEIRTKIKQYGLLQLFMNILK